MAKMKAPNVGGLPNTNIAANQGNVAYKQVTADNSGPTGNPNPDPGPAVPPSPAAQRTNYDPAAGWEQTKLNTPAADDTKYNFGRAAQDFTGWSRGNLQPLVDYYNTTYNGKAKVNGEDTIDFGESYGPVDVINGQNEGLQWVVGGSNGMVAPSQYGGGYGNAAAPPIGGASGLPDFASLYGGNTGNDPLSQTADNALAGIIQNKGNISGDSGLGDWISQYQKSSKDTTNARAESARETIDRARKSQLANNQGLLADRGLISAPGITQGSEASTYGRMEGDLAGQYATALRDIYSNQDSADQNALGLAVQREQNQASNYQAAITGIGQRQQMTSNIALQTLAQNVQWNQFMAQFGLDREKFAYDVQHGNIQQYQDLISLFLRSAGQSADGFV